MGLFRPATYQSFNPRSREGSDSENVGTVSKITVSIHAPAKGATEIHISLGGKFYVSIHAPAKGATVRETSTI